MSELCHTLALVDIERRQAFATIPALRRRLVESRSAVRRDGIVWIYIEVGNSLVGISAFGSGKRWKGSELEIKNRTDKLARKNDAEQLRLIKRRIRRLRLGPLTERLAWKLHAEVLKQRSSVLSIANDELAHCLWGREDRPKHWRKAIKECLRALSWLHISDHTNDEPAFGPTSTLVSDYGEIVGDGDGGTPRRSRFKIELGPGFLGILEECGAIQNDGSCTYQFATLGRKRKDPGSLRKLGRTGRLTQVFLPAKLGERAACDRFSASQHRLLQAIVRELTNLPREKPRSPRSPFIYENKNVPNFNGKGTLSASCLDDEAVYVGFNGNGFRRGLGYKLNSEGGWLFKAGYTPRRDTLSFLNDLKILGDELGLECFVIKHGDRILRPKKLLQLASAGRWSSIEEGHLRIYASDDFKRAWSRYFCGDATDLEIEPPVRDVATEVKAALHESKRSARSLAKEFGEDASFFNKVLLGKKSPPAPLAGKMKVWLRKRPVVESSSVDAVCDEDGNAGDGLLALATGYLKRGWSVIPQVPKTKRPYVGWKQFRERKPTIDQWRGWAKRWPNAGLMLVLGPVSNVIVVDVDGKEAHDAMLEHLGRAPIAPKAISGSGEPFKFHLFFRHPEGVQTKAKFTPWHPKLEFRGTGGALVLPPSLHPSGNRYRWDGGARIFMGDLPPLCKPILQTLRVHDKPSVSTTAKTQKLRARFNVDDLSLAESTLRMLSGEHAYEPGWNDRIFKAACDLKAQGVPIEIAKELLLAGAKPRTKNDREQVLATIESAYSRNRSPSRR